MPTRYLNGLLPAALISAYHFWRGSDGMSLTGARVAAAGAATTEEAADTPYGKAIQAEAQKSDAAAKEAAAATEANAAATKGAAAPKQAAGTAVAGSDVVTVQITAAAPWCAARRSTPPAPINAESRRLIATTSSGRGLSDGEVGRAH